MTVFRIVSSKSIDQQKPRQATTWWDKFVRKSLFFTKKVVEIVETLLTFWPSSITLLETSLKTVVLLKNGCLHDITRGASIIPCGPVELDSKILSEKICFELTVRSLLIRN